MTRSKLQNKNIKSESKKLILGLDDQGLNYVLNSSEFRGSKEGNGAVNY